MTTYTYEDYLYSDLHKDSLGFRPSKEMRDAWDAMTPDKKQQEWDRLNDELENSEFFISNEEMERRLNK